MGLEKFEAVYSTVYQAVFKLNRILMVHLCEPRIEVIVDFATKHSPRVERDYSARRDHTPFPAIVFARASHQKQVE
jgi:hypothetical protein